MQQEYKKVFKGTKGTKIAYAYWNLLLMFALHWCKNCFCSIIGQSFLFPPLNPLSFLSCQCSMLTRGRNSHLAAHFVLLNYSLILLFSFFNSF